MKKMMSLILATSLLSSMTTGMAVAGGGSGKFMRFFDLNEDGNVTQEEFNQAATDRFKRMDKNGDGTVTRDEFKSYVMQQQQDRKQKHFARIDRNGDGSIAREEYLRYKTEKAEKRFSRMDKDGNGSLSAEEMSHSARHYKGKHRYDRIFKNIDANQDGNMTQQESFAAWSKWFARIDKNGDKVVSSDELADYRYNKMKNR